MVCCIKNKDSVVVEVIVDGLECLSFSATWKIRRKHFSRLWTIRYICTRKCVPKKNLIDRVERNGLPTLSTCREWTATGEDTGLPVDIYA